MKTLIIVGLVIAFVMLHGFNSFRNRTATLADGNEQVAGDYKVSNPVDVIYSRIANFRSAQ